MASKWRVRKKRQKKKQFFCDLKQGLEEALAYERGELQPQKVEVRQNGIVSVHLKAPDGEEV